MSAKSRGSSIVKIILVVTILLSSVLFAKPILQGTRDHHDDQSQRVTVVFGTTNAKHTLLYRQAQEVLTFAFNQLGYDFRLLHMPNKRALIWTNDKKLDGVAFRVASLDAQLYPNLIRVDESLFIIEQSVFSRQNIAVDGWSSLSQLTVAYEQGTQFIEENRQHFKALYPVISTVKAFDMVYDGGADITITSQATGEMILKNYRARFNDKISVQTPPLVELNLYSFMHKQHQDLAEKLQLTLQQMKKDGNYQRLLEKAK
ncbi:substrate-binding periplasmic protein [Thalassotalea ganghwensis]